MAQIRAFEEAHPEMEDQFPQIIQDVTGIATEEFRAAFSQIQDQFEEMLEADRQKTSITDADHEAMREKLDTQASLINAGFLARLKVAEGSGKHGRRNCRDRCVGKTHRRENG